MIIVDYELELLKEILILLNNTHQYETELYEEITESINRGECENINSLLEWCKNQLSSTHCEDTEVYDKLSEYV